jgi:hypothetical protein
MEPIKMTVKDFLSKIAAPRGITINDIERQLQSELVADKDYAMTVGAEGQLYIIPIAEIRAYFGAKVEKPKEFTPVDDESFKKMMDFDATIPVKISPEPEAPHKVVKKDAK